MSEKEKDVIRKIALLVPKLSKDNQSYILGVAEGMAIAKEVGKVAPVSESDTGRR